MILTTYRTFQNQTNYTGGTIPMTQTPPVSSTISTTEYTVLPMGMHPEQAWFWTEEWQSKEQEADADIAAGRYTEYDDIDSFLSSL